MHKINYGFPAFFVALTGQYEPKTEDPTEVSEGASKHLPPSVAEEDFQQ